MALVSGYGTSLTWNAVAISQRTVINGPAMKMGEVEGTTLDSTIKAYLATLADVGEISMTIFYDPTLHKSLVTDFFAKKVQDIVISFPDPASQTTPPASLGSFTTKGFINGFTPGGMEPEGLVSADISFRLTNVVTAA